MSFADMERFQIEPCFARNPSFEQQSPDWMARRPLGPLTSAKTPLRAVPDLNFLPGLVKIEQILSPSGNQRHHCAATRISRHWFLTAAHCVQMRGTSSSVYDMIIVGPKADVLQEDAIIVPISGAVCHRAWYSQTGKFDDDIALVHVDDVSTLSGIEIAKLDLAEPELSLADITNARFAGWGKNGENRFLQGGPLNLVTFGETFIMANNGGDFGPCVGASGGPLFVDSEAGTRVVGVLSSVTTDACPPYDLAFYMRVKSFQSWIDRTTRICRQKGQFVCMTGLGSGGT